MPNTKSSPRRPTSRKAVNPAPSDPTRAKLLDAATEVFADRGYYAATVREISRRAGANIASVNYHFGDKLGLYTEVLRSAVSSVGLAARAAFERNLPPEQTIRTVVKVMLSRLYGQDKPSVPFRLMRHELSHPTPALAHAVDEIIRPNFDRLRGAVGATLGRSPDDLKTRLSTQSIMGQVFFYPLTAPVLGRLWPQFKMTPEQLDSIAEHIADFSLAALRAQKVKA